MTSVNPAVLSANPTFAQLYHHLSTTLLASNGQTYSLASSASRQETVDRAENLYFLKAKTVVLTKALTDIAYDGNNGFDSALRERCSLAAVFLQTGRLDEYADRLLEGDLDQFRRDLEARGGTGLVQLLRKNLKEHHDALLAISMASKTDDSLQVSGSLVSNLRRKVSAIEYLKTGAVSSAHGSLADRMSERQSLHQEEIELQIQHLERHVHGIKSRSSKAQAEYHSTVSAGMAAKARILLLQARQGIYSEEVQEALENYRSHLSVIEERLQERERQLVDESLLFREQGERRMRECGMRYTAATQEIENLKSEITRLETDVK